MEAGTAASTQRGAASLGQDENPDTFDDLECALEFFEGVQANKREAIESFAVESDRRQRVR
jgi:hypothetical protein